MRIAIADDERDVTEYLKVIIEEMGHLPVSFSDGNALAQALTRDTFDLVIVDWAMPGKDGLDIIKWAASALDESPPIIMMTNRTAKTDIADALNAGAADYITKPEDRGVIAARISAVLRRNAPG
nr:response regulator transcription factor [Sphingorhabdus sp.]